MFYDVFRESHQRTRRDQRLERLRVAPDRHGNGTNASTSTDMSPESPTKNSAICTERLRLPQTELSRVNRKACSAAYRRGIPTRSGAGSPDSSTDPPDQRTAIIVEPEPTDLALMRTESPCSPQRPAISPEPCASRSSPRCRVIHRRHSGPRVIDPDRVHPPLALRVRHTPTRGPDRAGCHEKALPALASETETRPASTDRRITRLIEACITGTSTDSIVKTRPSPANGPPRRNLKGRGVLRHLNLPSRDRTKQTTHDLARTRLVAASVKRITSGLATPI